MLERPPAPPPGQGRTAAFRASDEYLGYLERQARRIVLQTGSADDFRAFLEETEGIDLAPYGQFPEKARAMTVYGQRARAKPREEAHQAAIQQSAKDLIQQMMGAPGAGSEAGLAFQVHYLQSATLGFGDEGAGSILGHIDGRGTQWGRDVYRAMLEELGSTHGKASLAGEATGAFVNPLGLAGRIPMFGGQSLRQLGGQVNRARRMALYGAEGTVAGGVASFGYEDGELSERARAMLWGAPAGGGFGAFVALGPKAAGAVLGGTTAWLLSRGDKTTAVGGAGAGAVAGSLGRPGPLAASAAQRVQAWMNRMQKPEGIPTVAAKGYWADALTKQFGTLRKAEEAARRLIAERRGAPVSAGDLADGPAADMLEAANKLLREQSPHYQGIIQREAGQPARILESMGRELRIGIEGGFALADDLVRHRRAHGDILFDQAQTKFVRITPVMRAQLATPEVQAQWHHVQTTSNAWLAAENAARVNKGLPPLGYPKIPDLVIRTTNKKGEVIDQPVRGKPIRGKVLNEDLPVFAIQELKTLAGEAAAPVYVPRKVGEPARISSSREPMTLETRVGILVDEAARGEPAYARALALYRDESHALYAHDLGKGGESFTLAGKQKRTPAFHNRPPGRITQELAFVRERARTPEQAAYDVQLYKIGALQDLAAVMKEVKPGSVARRIFGAAPDEPTGMRNRVRALFEKDETAFQAVWDDLVAEESAIRTGSRYKAAAKAKPGKDTDLFSRITRQQVGTTLEQVQLMSQTGWVHSIRNAIAVEGMAGAKDPEDLIRWIRSLEAYRPHLPGAIMGTAGQVGRGASRIF